jgi:L,D-peptidoglycan transpeptidase YkuD (ErfK/YbiS/YcfS/YnhG family)
VRDRPLIRRWVRRASRATPPRARGVLASTVLLVTLSPATLLGATAAVRPQAGACARAPRGSSQLIVAAGAHDGARSGRVSLLGARQGCWRLVAGPYGAFFGWGGISAHKREGDGRTPEGSFAISTTIYGISPDPGLQMNYVRLSCGDWWDEDPTSPRYNRFVALRCGSAPTFAGTSEALWREVPAYDLFADIEYNADPVVDGAGSAIFLHVSTGQVTNGCVALSENELRRILRALRPDAHPRIEITTLARLGAGVASAAGFGEPSG